MSIRTYRGSSPQTSKEYGRGSVRRVFKDHEGTTADTTAWSAEANIQRGEKQKTIDLKRKTDSGVQPTQEELEAVKQQYDAEFGVGEFDGLKKMVGSDHATMVSYALHWLMRPK